MKPAMSPRMIHARIDIGETLFQSGVTGGTGGASTWSSPNVHRGFHQAAECADARSVPRRQWRELPTGDLSRALSLATNRLCVTERRIAKLDSRRATRHAMDLPSTPVMASQRSPCFRGSLSFPPYAGGRFPCSSRPSQSSKTDVSPRRRVPRTLFESEAPGRLCARSLRLALRRLGVRK